MNIYAPIMTGHARKIRPCVGSRLSLPSSLPPSPLSAGVCPFAAPRARAADVIFKHGTRIQYSQYCALLARLYITLSLSRSKRSSSPPPDTVSRLISASRDRETAYRESLSAVCTLGLREQAARSNRLIGEDIGERTGRRIIRSRLPAVRASRNSAC